MPLNNSTLIFTGTPIHEGYVSGPFHFVKEETIVVSEAPCLDTVSEVKRVKAAFLKAKEQIEQLIEKKKASLSSEELKIFEAHIMMIDDPEFQDQILLKISNEKYQAIRAVSVVSHDFATMLSEIPDPHLAARSQDIRDIAQRIMKLLSRDNDSSSQNDVKALSTKGIYYFKELTPSMIAELDLTKVQGVLSAQSGTTSHAAILLRTMEIPSLFDIKLDASLNDLQNSLTLLDAKNGKCFISPDSEQIKAFEDQTHSFNRDKEELFKLRNQPAITQDGVAIKLHANMNNPSELAAIEKYHADGIGLFRTEFLFLDRHSPPTEEEQFEIYKNTLQALKGKKVTIRTVDIGGDKVIPYLPLPKEENPFLGLRGLRLSLKYPELFRTQLRALLRASPFGNLYIMYPMVTQLNEWQKAQEIFLEEKQNLLQQGITVSETIRSGIMIEVPSAAIMAADFAKQVDFFSIGTNDLIQYTCACDRLNSDVKSLYTPYEPSVLRLIKMVVDAAKRNSIEVSLCGEMGAMIDLLPFLVGCGMTEWSMAPQSLLKIKKKIIASTYEACELLTKKLLECTSAQEVERLIHLYTTAVRK